MISAVLKVMPQNDEPVFEDEAEFPTDVISLNESPYLHVRRVCCHVRNGVARLEGRVPTYHQKQLAQEMVRRVPGVTAIHNHVVVAKAQ